MIHSQLVVHRRFSVVMLHSLLTLITNLTHIIDFTLVNSLYYVREVLMDGIYTENIEQTLIDMFLVELDT